MCSRVLRVSCVALSSGWVGLSISSLSSLVARSVNNVRTQMQMTCFFSFGEVGRLGKVNTAYSMGSTRSRRGPAGNSVRCVSGNSVRCVNHQAAFVGHVLECGDSSAGAD